MALGELSKLYETAQAWRELEDILQRTIRIIDVPEAVSYTHLDVYKRQGESRAR